MAMILGVASMYPAASGSSQDPHPTMHLVRGEQRHGLIVDPGASAPLMGTETLRAFHDEVLQPLGHDVSFFPTDATFVGVDGVPTAGQAACRFPIGLEGAGEVRFTTDLIGGEASKCPALLPWRLYGSIKP